MSDEPIESIQPTGRAKGGVARAAKLTPERRSEIASIGGKARSSTKERIDPIPAATHIGELKIGDLVLPCAVLPDGSRLISQGGIAAAFGPTTGGWQARKKKGEEHTSDLPPFLVATSLQPFISDDVRTLVSSPKRYKDPRGGPVRIGVDATLIPKICEVWLKARDADKLTKIQRPVAYRAEILMRSLASIGIVALVDEATGYQEVRDKKTLAALLDKYLLKEFAKWAKRFPDTFYKEMFRLRGWDYPSVSGGKPGVVGRYTMNIVYERLAPGLVLELETRNPKEDGRRRKATHHQWLTEDLGLPALSEHIHAITGLMRACDDWDQFKRMLDRSFPIKGDQLPLRFDD